MRRFGFVVVAALLLGGCAFQPGGDGSGESGEGNEELMRNEGAISAPGGDSAQGSRSPADQQQRREGVKDRITWVMGNPVPEPWNGGNSGGTGGNGSSGSSE
jgi:hypothetical protein